MLRCNSISHGKDVYYLKISLGVGVAVLDVVLNTPDFVITRKGGWNTIFSKHIICSRCCFSGAGIAMVLDVVNKVLRMVLEVMNKS